MSRLKLFWATERNSEKRDNPVLDVKYMNKNISREIFLKKCMYKNLKDKQKICKFWI